MSYRPGPCQRCNEDGLGPTGEITEYGANWRCPTCLGKATLTPKRCQVLNRKPTEEEIGSVF